MLVPLDIHRLAWYVGAVCIASALVAVTRGVSLGNLCFSWLSASGVFWVVAVVSGAPPTKHVLHTGLVCLYVASLVVNLTASSACTLATFPQQTRWQAWLSLPLLPTAVSTADFTTTEQFNKALLASCQIHAALFVTVPFQILRLYDWGSQIQRWPLPIILGSTYGFVLGTVLGITGAVALHCSPKLREGYKFWTMQLGGMVSNEKRME